MASQPKVIGAGMDNFFAFIQSKYLVVFCDNNFKKIPLIDLTSSDLSNLKRTNFCTNKGSSSNPSSTSSHSVVPDSSGSSSIGAIIGGVIGGLVLLAIVIAFFIFRKRRVRKSEYGSENGYYSLQTRYGVDQELKNNRTGTNGTIVPSEEGPRVAVLPLPLSGQIIVNRSVSKALTGTPDQKCPILPPLEISKYEEDDAYLASPSKAQGSLILSQYKVERAPVEIIPGSYIAPAEDQDTSEALTVKWLSTESEWKREISMLGHLRSPIYIVELQALFHVPGLKDFPYISIFGPYRQTFSTYLSEATHTSLVLKDILKSMTNILAWCHKKDIVHLNIQPCSFVLDDIMGQLTWKLWNFNQSYFVGDIIEAPRLSVHTSPEIIQAFKNQQVVRASLKMDMWSMGCLIFEMFARKPLFGSIQEVEQLQRGYEIPVKGNLEDDIYDLVKKLVKIDPEQRLSVDDIYGYVE